LIPIKATDRRRGKIAPVFTENDSMLAHLSSGEVMFLALIIVSFAALSATLAYVNVQAGRRPEA
jgi:hypothetical protein